MSDDVFTMVQEAFQEAEDAGCDFSEYSLMDIAGEMMDGDAFYGKPYQPTFEEIVAALRKMGLKDRPAAL